MVQPILRPQASARLCLEFVVSDSPNQPSRVTDRSRRLRSLVRNSRSFGTHETWISGSWKSVFFLFFDKMACMLIFHGDALHATGQRAEPDMVWLVSLLLTVATSRTDRAFLSWLPTPNGCCHSKSSTGASKAVQVLACVRQVEPSRLLLRVDACSLRPAIQSAWANNNVPHHSFSNLQ